jgi:TolA-binding protein
MVGVYVSEEDFTLVHNGSAFVFPISEVSYIFAGKPPTKKAALKFIAANPGYLDIVEYLYAYSRAQKRLQKRVDEMNAKIEELKKRLEEQEEGVCDLIEMSESRSDEEESPKKVSQNEN